MLMIAILTKGFKTKVDFKVRIEQPIIQKIAIVAIPIYLYCMINFGIGFIQLESGTPDIWRGSYVLQNHGELIKALSLTEYMQYKQYHLRLTSGFWIMMYYLVIGMTMLYIEQMRQTSIEQ